MKIEQMEKIVDAWRAGTITLGEAESLSWHDEMDRVRKAIESGKQFIMMSSCCCSEHTEKPIEATLIMKPHWIEFRPKGMDVCADCGFHHPGGTCYDS